MKFRDLEEERILQGLRLLKSLKPSQDWKKQTREKLLITLFEEPVKKEGIFSLPLFVSLSNSFKNFSPRFLTLKTAAITGLVISLIGGTTFTTVAAVSTAQKSLPGEFLYPVKLSFEKAQVIFIGEEHRTTLEAEFAGKRLEELNSLAGKVGQEQGPEQEKKVMEAVKNFRSQLSSVKNKLEKTKGSSDKKQAAEIVQNLNRRTQDYEEELLKANHKLPESLQEKIREEVEGALASVEEVNLESLKMMIEKQAAGKISDEEIMEIVKQVSQKIQKTEEEIEKVEKKAEAVLATLVNSESSSEEENLEDKGQKTVAQVISEEPRKAKEALEEAKGALAENNLPSALEKVVISKGIMKEVGTLIENTSEILEAAKVAEEKRKEEEKTDNGDVQPAPEDETIDKDLPEGTIEKEVEQGNL